MEVEDRPASAPEILDEGRGRRERRAARLAALVEVILCSDFPTQLALAALLTSIGYPPYVGGRLSPSFIFALSLIDSAALIGLIFFFMWMHGERPREALLGSRPAIREAVLGLVLIPGVFLLVLGILSAIQSIAPWLHNVPINPLQDLIRSPRDAAMLTVVAIVAGGLREEIQRGFILRRFEQHLGGPAIGLILVSASFGAGHALQGWDAAIATSALGAFWGVIYLRRRSIVAPVVSHSGFNTAEVFRYLVSGT